VPILISHCSHLELLDEIFQDGYEPLFPQGKRRVRVVRLVRSIRQIVAFSIPAKLGTAALPGMAVFRSFCGLVDRRGALLLVQYEGE
jgi:hypothetical protein